MTDIRHFRTAADAVEFLKGLQANFTDLPAAKWQKDLKPGDCFVQLSALRPNLPCDIYGEVVESEYEEDRRMFRSRPDLRLCKCYSPLCPEGEYGTLAIIDIDGTMPREQFDDIRQKGWPAWQIPNP